MIDHVPVQVDRQQNHLRLIVDVPPDQQAAVSRALTQLEAEQRPVGDLLIETLLTAVEQAYFWTPEWQAKEQASNADRAGGRFKTFDSMEDMLDFLDNP